MLISIIVVNYNTPDLIKNVLKSIEDSNLANHSLEVEVIIIDNSDRRPVLPEVSLTYLQTQLITNSTNLGFGSACNQGILASNGEYICFINSDASFGTDCLSLLVSAFQTFPEAGVVCPNIYNQANAPSTSFGRIYPGILFEINELLFRLPSRLIYNKRYNFNHSIKPLVFFGPISGACFMIRADLIRTAGGFDDRFFLYYEDTDLMYRLKKLGVSMINVPQASVVHIESKSQESRKKTLIYSFTSKWVYLKKHKKNSRLVHLLFTFGSLSKILFYLITRNNIKRDDWLSIWKTERQTYNLSKRAFIHA
jgi:GT2 family glycosyltransferase